MQNLNSEQLAYTAGLFDGEGSVTTKLSRGGGIPNARINLTNTNPRAVMWMKELFGGSISDQSTSPSRPKTWKVSYTWELSGNKAAEVLRLLLPYLILKRAQAEQAIALQAIPRRKGSPWKKGNTTVENMVQALLHRENIQVLNRRGLPDGDPSGSPLEVQ